MRKVLEHLTKLSVENLEHQNQFIIEYSNEKNEILSCFQSYKTLIAVYNRSTHELMINNYYWDYSKTTMKHLKIFINEYTIYEYKNKLQFTLFLASKNEKIFLF